MKERETILNELGFKTWKKGNFKRIYLSKAVDFLDIKEGEKCSSTLIINGIVFDRVALNFRLELLKQKKNRRGYYGVDLNLYYDCDTKEYVNLESEFSLKYDIANIIIETLENHINNANIESEEENTINNSKEVNNTNTFISIEQYQKNVIIKRQEKYIKILKVEALTLSKSEIEAVYGGCMIDNEEDYNMHKNSYRYTYIEASETEKQEIIKKGTAAQELKENKEHSKQTLCDYIYRNSIQENKSDKLEENISDAKQICELDNFKSIRINDNLNTLYLLEKNWSDYDCWDYNNCKIGICKTCTLSEKLHNLLDNYLKACEALQC